MRTAFDVIIIGAGPAGSTAAIRLAQAGWSVALIEKQRFPRRKVCGECLAASNLPLLDSLGLGRAFHALAGPELKRLALMRGMESIYADLPPYAGGRHAWGKALGREHLDALLLQRAIEAGATVLQPWTVRAVQGQAGAYRCIAQAFDSKAEMHLNAPLLIAAHGSWEPGLASGPGRQVPPDGRDLFAFKANFAHAQLEDELLPVLAFEGGYGGMVMGDHGWLTLACCIRRDRLSACRSRVKSDNAGEAVQSYLVAECDGVRQALDGAVRQGKWLSVGPIRPGIRMPRDGGRYFLIGNAAGEAHPIIGEGMSMAMQSAWLACEFLIAAPAALRDAGLQRKLMREYARAWHAHFARRMHFAATFAHAAMRPLLTRTLLPVLRRWPEIMTSAARWSGKVSQACCASHQAPVASSSAPMEESHLHEISNGENA